MTDPNIRTKSLKTPLHILVKTEKIYEKKFGIYEEKFVKCFEALVKRNADCNAVDDKELSVLHHAVIGNNLKAVELLLALENIDFYVNISLLDSENRLMKEGVQIIRIKKNFLKKKYWT